DGVPAPEFQAADPRPYLPNRDERAKVAANAWLTASQSGTAFRLPDGWTIYPVCRVSDQIRIARGGTSWHSPVCRPREALRTPANPQRACQKPAPLALQRQYPLRPMHPTWMTALPV